MRQTHQTVNISSHRCFSLCCEPYFSLSRSVCVCLCPSLGRIMRTYASVRLRACGPVINDDHSTPWVDHEWCSLYCAGVRVPLACALGWGE